MCCACDGAWSILRRSEVDGQIWAARPLREGNMARKWQTGTVDITRIPETLEEWSIEGWHVHSIVKADTVEPEQAGEAEGGEFVHVIAYRDELGL